MKKLQLYIHIPFCIRKCLYCDFLSAPADADTRKAYVNSLLKEIQEKAPDYQDYEISTAFIGGGTPTILETEQLEALMSGLRQSFCFADGAEITVECNPGTLDRTKAEGMRMAGINRISFGLQSVHRLQLEQLGRIHTYQQFLESFQIARDAGFQNINVDLMYGLPNQSTDSWEETLQSIIALGPEHISAYGLIIEPGTLFAQTYGADEHRRMKGMVPDLLPTEEQEREMHHIAIRKLAAAGYGRYEISNYAKTGFCCRHNIGYWTLADYLGLGLGAASLHGRIRFQNHSDLVRYCAGDFTNAETEERDSDRQMEEFIFLGLRMAEGISEDEFIKRFGCRIQEVYGKEIERFLDQKLLGFESGRFFLTVEGMDISNYIFSAFIR